MLDLAMVQKNNRLVDLQRIYARRKKEKKHEGNIAMVDQRAPGTCNVCLAENVNVKKSHGVYACSMCSTVQSRVRKHPALMVDEIKRLIGDEFFPAGGAEELVGQMRAALGMDADDNVSDPVEVCRSIVDQLDDLSSANNHLAAQLQDDNLDLIEGNGSTVTQEQVTPDPDLIPLTRLIGDPELLGAINSLSVKLRVQ